MGYILCNVAKSISNQNQKTRSRCRDILKIQRAVRSAFDGMHFARPPVCGAMPGWGGGISVSAFECARVRRAAFKFQ